MNDFELYWSFLRVVGKHNQLYTYEAIVKDKVRLLRNLSSGKTFSFNDTIELNALIQDIYKAYDVYEPIIPASKFKAVYDSIVTLMEGLGFEHTFSICFPMVGILRVYYDEEGCTLYISMREDEDNVFLGCILMSDNCTLLTKDTQEYSFYTLNLCVDGLIVNLA